MQLKANEQTEVKQQQSQIPTVIIRDRFEYNPQVYKINFFHEFYSEAEKIQNYLEVFERARPDDVIYIYLNSCGGSIYTLNLMLNAMKRSMCKNIITRVNFAASAAAMFAIASDNIEFNDNASIMFHDFSTCESGKSQEIASAFMHAEKEVHKMMWNICKRVLSEEEFTQMINGKDFWFSAEECVKRLKKYKESLEKKHKPKVKGELKNGMQKENKKSKEVESK